MRLALPGSTPIFGITEGADGAAGAIIGLAAVGDGGTVDAADAPVELIIGCPGCSIGVAGFIIGAIIGRGAVTACCVGAVVVVPAGRIIADDDVGVAVRMLGAAAALDPDGGGGGALPFSLIGCVPPPRRPAFAVA
jgi:hypothetical protein